MDRFVGDWEDASGRLLRIAAAGPELARVSFFEGKKRRPLRRRGFFVFLRRPALDLPAKLAGGVLVVELDEPGLGPTMRLAPRTEDGVRTLVPEVGIGLYGDFEDDLGVPWVFPLSVYRRASPP